MKNICSDLENQYLELENLVAGLDEAQWRLETPFFNWTIFDEVGHIAFFDHEALLAIEETEQFKQRVNGVAEVILTGGSMPAYTNQLLGLDSPENLMSLWRDTRTRLLQRLGEMAPRDRVPWYGPDMSARSFTTARLMETWAHSQDVFDTLCIKRNNGAGLRHVAHIGVITFGWSFMVRGLPVPEFTPRVELTGPGGENWDWGETNAPERVAGSAEEFCLVATQRRHVADTSLQADGETVKKWLTFAQAFAGAPQDHPEPGSRVIV